MIFNDKNALIAGCGYVGSALAKKLIADDWHVHGIRRNKAGLEGDGFTIISKDLSKEFTLPKRYSCVFYLASADSYDAKSYDATYSVGVLNLLAALSAYPKPDLIIFVSSTSVYAQSNGELINENSPVTDEGFARQALLSGEKLILESGIPAMVVRFSGIYGPGRTRFRDSILSGQTGFMETSCFTNRIHLEDCAGVLIHLMNKGLPGEIYIGTDSEPSDYNEVVKWLFAEANIQPVAINQTESSSIHRGNKRCSNAKLLSLGYKFQYPNFRFGYGSLSKSKI